MLVRCIKESEAMQGAWGSDESESSGPMQQDKMEERMEAEGGEEKGWDVAGRGKGSRSGGSGWDCVRYKREGVTLLKQAVALRPLDHSILGSLQDLLHVEIELHERRQAQSPAHLRQVDGDDPGLNDDENDADMSAQCGSASDESVENSASARGGREEGGRVMGKGFKRLRKRYEWVESLYSEALYERPSDAALLWGFAQLLSVPGLRIHQSDARRRVNIRLSTQSLEKALAMAPNSAKIHLAVADMEKHQKAPDYERALEHYVKAAQLQPAEPELWFKTAYLVHYHLRNYTNAEGFYQECLSRDPVHVQALTHYGLLLCQALGRFVSAGKLLVRALQLVPDDADAKLGLSFVRLIKLGQANEERLRRSRAGGVPFGL